MLCDFFADDSFMVVLQGLTKLTMLEVGAIQLLQPTPGHVSGLQLLPIATPTEPNSLLQTLLPLLPLPSLTALTHDGEQRHS